MNVNFNEISIVQWFPDLEKHKCGYCKDNEGSVSYGMWAESLTVYDYQDLIDRGWRRSGKYCYKPVMDQTCCPLYTIKCHPLEVALTKSQKKVIKRMNKFLSSGVLKEDQTASSAYLPEDNTTIADNFIKDKSHAELDRCKLQSSIIACASNSTSGTQPESTALINQTQAKLEKPPEPLTTIKPQISCCKKGVGPDPDKPLRKKAKLVRLEKKLSKGCTASCNKTAPKVKTLEEFLNAFESDLKQSLTVKLVPTSHPGSDWEASENIEFELYKKYQIVVHNDPPEKCTKKSFLRFLVHSPLQPVPFVSKAPPGYGSFHQQYWINDKLIAVGVIDILPNCVSSVYFFYDPDYRSLTLGTYGSLKEIEFTRYLNSLEPSIQYYYMGFYVHSCPKMRYKGKLSPSYLLCPETYKWFPIEQCVTKLETEKYSRLNTDVDDIDCDFCTSKDVSLIKVLSDDYELMYSDSYKMRYGGGDIFNNIALLVGKKCLHKIVFVISK